LWSVSSKGVPLIAVKYFTLALQVGTCDAGEFFIPLSTEEWRSNGLIRA